MKAFAAHDYVVLSSVSAPIAWKLAAATWFVLEFCCCYFVFCFCIWLLCSLTDVSGWYFHISTSLLDVVCWLLLQTSLSRTGAA